MLTYFPSGSRYFELEGVPYVQTTSASGQHAVFNCAFEPPVKVDHFQRLQHWEEITAEVFERLRVAHLTAQNVLDEER